ncbi:uncharacterized protein B0I36DRAFT_348083 [Microdochium trichocladiopsis]|uniref:Uncharacterized protein n=1 Tax=Microdochium trichocladiopsis TaxID=1682393 RepID=A0A9P8Y924_9PEZI|nr:uncharacterized protein B0I36DRAFT_348083 [Microdochium trichocladiopsis]KAH7032946.1 hypothetical protein B0I36DRAFT_348083 [Microdochium trichocladiopsis]
MTQSKAGPSLPQAQDTTDTDDDRQHGLDSSDSHIHSHPRNGHLSRSSSAISKHNHNHGRFHNHRHLHNHHHHARSEQQQQQQQPKHLQPRADSDQVIVIETISVIHIVDAHGSTIAFSTLPPAKPRTTTITGNLSLPTKVGTAPDLPAPLVPSGIEGSPSLGLPTDTSNGDIIISLPPLDPTVKPSDISMPTVFPSLSYSPLTSTPLSGGPHYPSFGGVTNSTTTQAVATSLLPNNGTGSINGTAIFSATLTSSLHAAGLTTDSASVTSSTRTPSSWSSTTGTSTSTTNGGAVVPTGGGFTDDSSDPSVAPPQATDSSTPPAATVAGSVIGGIAGLAMLIFLALALMRFKRRQAQQSLESGSTARGGLDSSAAARSGGGDDGGRGGPAMSQRPRSVPFAIPAALAALSGMRRSALRSGTPPASAGTGTGERGFSKISGRKLPPVIQFGGDGYSDPRDTMMTMDSSQVSYRDSAGILAGGNQKFAVGAPMRPESGIPVFHEGPSRSPMIDQGPFSDHGPYVRSESPTSTLTPPRPPRTLDPVGRSHISNDGSNRSTLSVSRFTEEL